MSERPSRRPLLFACLVVLAGAAGCARGPRADHAVSGTVTYGGEPVWEGVVVFLGPDNQVRTATLAPDGTYRVVNPPTGKVRVGVANYAKTTPPAADDGPAEAGRAASAVPARPHFQLPARYAEPGQSGLTVEIAPGQERADIDLERRPDDPAPLRKADLPAVGVGVGQVAPEISGEDLDGKPLKLSGQRGRAVVLLFWGHWCSLCRERFGHDRSLVERMKGRPFVLLGVNCDPDRATAREKNASAKINWRSWWDGGAALSGTVASAWQVPGLPYVVVIDRDGVVRHRGLHGDALDRALEPLLDAPAPRRPSKGQDPP